MKTTNSKDSVKVNQILPIMQGHFGQSMNLARIKLMALLLHALCVVPTVSLHKLADTMPTAVDKDSNLRRLQRFFARYVLDLDIIARMIFSQLPVKTGLVLSMDRTDWKFGEFNINILMLGITYKGIAFPLIFSLLSKRGNSNREERKKIMEHFIRLFGAECIDSLVADREFIRKEWTGWLNSHRIRYYIRIRQNFICFNRPEDAILTYKKRWEIETAFRAMKSSGFNIEDTHMRDMDRIERLVAIVCIAFAWSYLVGKHKDTNVKPIRILKHGRKAKSLVKYGLEEISTILMRPAYTPKFDVFKFLSYLTKYYTTDRI